MGSEKLPLFLQKKLEKIKKYGILVNVNFIYLSWPVGEMVNTLPSQGNIHGFEPHTGHHLKTTQIIR